MPRITSDISIELRDTIWEMSKEKQWSFSKTVSVLLQYAVREKLRKSKKNNTEHNATNPRQNNAG